MKARERSGVKWICLKVSAKPIRECEVLEKIKRELIDMIIKKCGNGKMEWLTLLCT